MKIIGNNILLDGKLYKTIPEGDSETSEECQPCAFHNNAYLCDQIIKPDFLVLDRLDLFCGSSDIAYKLADQTKGKKKLLIL